MISAVFCVLFGLSLLPGRKPLCIRFAERLSDGIMPDGAEGYCRRLTWVWFFVLFANSAVMLTVRFFAAWHWEIAAKSAFSALVVASVFAIEGAIRRRRFRVVFHTSGSTGASKTIVKTFEMLAKEVAMHRRMMQGVLAEKPRFLATIDPAHMFGTLWRVMLPKAAGCEVDGEIILTPESLIAKMREANRVVLVTTPSFLERFTAYADQYEVPRNCVEIVTSGALLRRRTALATKLVFGIAPREIFGSTETGGVAMRRQDESAAEEFDWRVFDGVRVATTKDSRLKVWSKFSVRSPYVLGDGVVLNEDGRRFHLNGRLDRLVKINEERVNLAEMEEKVRALGYRDCALVELKGERGACLGLVIAGEAEPPLGLRTKLNGIFPKGTTPRRFRFVDAIPKNTQGKVLKFEIEKMF